MQEKAKRSTRDNGRVSTVEMQIAARVRSYPEEAITNLHQFIDEELLHECYEILNKQSASGVDHQTWEDYNKERKERIPQLLTAFKSGSYKAPTSAGFIYPRKMGGNNGR